MAGEINLQSLTDLDDADLISSLYEFRQSFIPSLKDEDIEQLVDSTGWPRTHVIEALTRAFAPYDRTSLRAMVRRGGGLKRETWLLAILAGKVFALASSVFFRSLSARVPLVIKPSSLEPNFSRLMVRHLQSGRLSNAVKILDGRSGLNEVIAKAPLCIAYGSDSTISQIVSIRQELPTVVGGHKESIVIVFREALNKSAAERLAAAISRDVSIYDQSGCLSPHLVLVEEGGEVCVLEFAQCLDFALRQEKLPPARLCLEEQARVRLFVEEHRDAFIVVRAPVPPAVIITNGSYRPGPGHRVVQVVSFRNVPELKRIAPELANRIQGLAYAGSTDRIKATLVAFPEYRPHLLCRPGRLQLPPADWPENGVKLTQWLAITARNMDRHR